MYTIIRPTYAGFYRLMDKGAVLDFSFNGETFICFKRGESYRLASSTFEERLYTSTLKRYDIMSSFKGIHWGSQ